MSIDEKAADCISGVVVGVCYNIGDILEILVGCGIRRVNARVGPPGLEHPGGGGVRSLAAVRRPIARKSYVGPPVSNNLIEVYKL